MAVTENQIMRYITESPSKVAFLHLQRHFCAAHRMKPRVLKAMVARMIRAGDLRYTALFGTSYLERSYDQPRAVSEHIVLKPAETNWPANQNQQVVSLARGAAFGAGEHPTTRMAIQLIDAALHAPPWNVALAALKAIDIGTGSGVLAIVAAKMGFGWVAAVDTDPNAVFEARKNVRLNQLESRISVGEGSLEASDGRYDLAIANLRTPTLVGLSWALDKTLMPDSMLILSGIRPDETTSIAEKYQAIGFFVQNNRKEKGWAALCLARGQIRDVMARPLA
ncbi:MAG: 50S ribosomal protein L11 methyltransferase [Desulfosarcina sp.]|jgi:ribosomal protein L11 methyltransferase